MADQDPALTATNYTPPSAVVNNTNIEEYVQAQVAAALAKVAAAQAAANAPKVLSPEEAARSAIDNHGEGKGVDERLHELYALVHLLATKVGI